VFDYLIVASNATMSESVRRSGRSVLGAPAASVSEGSTTEETTTEFPFSRRSGLRGVRAFPLSCV